MLWRHRAHKYGGVEMSLLTLFKNDPDDLVKLIRITVSLIFYTEGILTNLPRLTYQIIPLLLSHAEDLLTQPYAPLFSHTDDL